jgi:molybdopterin converting factor small subunit
VAGAVLVGLLVTYFAALRGDIHKADRERAAARKAVVGDLNARESAAVDAAATEMLNLVSFRRAHFEQDFRRALDGVTGSLRSDVQKNKKDTLDAMTKGKFDMTGKVTHKALEGRVTSGKGTGYTVLVTVEGYRSTSPEIPVQQNLSVTVVPQAGRWVASDVQNIGIDS